MQGDINIVGEDWERFLSILGFRLMGLKENRITGLQTLKVSARISASNPGSVFPSRLSDPTVDQLKKGRTPRAIC